MRRSLLRFEQIEAFIEAANAPSFRVAAERCALSPAALSRRIQAFSDHFGQQLFERTAAGAKLSDAGRRCLDELEPAYIALRDATRRVGRADDHKVSISLSHSLAIGWLIPRLTAFKAHQPDIQLLLKVDRTASLVRRGDTDIGICFSDIEAHGLAHEKLLAVDAAPVASPQLASTIERQQSAEFHCLAVTQPENLWSWWANATGEPDPCRLPTRFEFLQAMYESAAHGMGVALGSSATVLPYIESGRLRRLTLPAATYPGCYSMVALPDRKRRRAVATTWRWLATQAKATPRFA